MFIYLYIFIYTQQLYLLRFHNNRMILKKWIENHSKLRIGKHSVLFYILYITLYVSFIYLIINFIKIIYLSFMWNMMYIYIHIMLPVTHDFSPT